MFVRLHVRSTLNTLLASVALLAGAGAGSAQPAPAPTPAPAAIKAPALTIAHYRLGNGLEVVLAPDPAVTSVVTHVWYHVGSKDEVAGKTGFAHLFEHLMFKGSKHVPDGQFDLMLETAGGNNNGTTDNDRTNYFEQVPANFLELTLWLEADRLAGLWDAMNQGVLDNQRDVVKNERRQSYENAPYGVANLKVQQALWPEGHGNYNLTIGTMEDLTAASLADVEEFWRTYYRPSNATLVVAGGFDLASARALIEKYFGWLPALPKPKTRTLDAPVEPRATPVHLTTTDRVSVPKVIFAFRADHATARSTTDLGVAMQVLGGGKTSRLYRRLVMKDRLASQVYAYVSPQFLGSEVAIHAIARQGVSADALRAAIAEEVERLRTSPISADELLRARRTLEAGAVGELEDLGARAAALASWTAYTGTPYHLAEDLAELAAVTPDSVQAQCRRWLAPTAAVTMIVNPEASAPARPATVGGGS
ncbi:MAG: insulinase family protein [Kofleriaceae bacterium]|nr:insulinase family protein [Kofleriaceae bacterium]